MIINENYIAKRIKDKLTEKNPVKYKYVRVQDIERIIRYYQKVIIYLIKIGAFITLPVYKTHQKTNNIRITPIERNYVKTKFMNRWKRVWHLKKLRNSSDVVSPGN